VVMKLYFKDTNLSYGQISDLMKTHIGPSGPDTWENGTEIGFETGMSGAGYIEIYDDNHPHLPFVVLKW